MDLQQAQDRREALPGERGDRRVMARQRDADARLRHEIREAFARQRSNEAPSPDAVRLHVVRQPEQ